MILNFRNLDYLHVLRDMNFLLFPRVFGYPLQKMALDASQFVSLIKTFNKKGPCFTSHNAYNKFNDFGDPIEVCMSNLFFDFDDDSKVENAQLDVLNLAEHLEHHKLDYTITFSASKGFHIYIHLKDEIIPINAALRAKYIALHNWVGRMTRTADPHVADVRRLCRIPGTENVKSPGQYCIPLTLEQTRNLTLPEIQELSKKPERTIIKYRSSKEHGNRFPLDDVVELMGVSLVKSSMDRINAPLRRSKVKDDESCGGESGAFIRYLNALIWRPCVWSELSTPNPLHFARFCAAVQLIQTMRDYEEVCLAWDRMADHFGYVDRFRTTGGMKVSHSQIRHIMQRGYIHPGQDKIEVNGLCFGEGCPFYNTRCG